MMNLKINGWTNGTKEYYGFRRNHGLKMEFPLMTFIISANLFALRMEETLKQKAIYERSWGDATQGVMNFSAWLKGCFGIFHELDYELLVKLKKYWWKMNDHEYVSRTFNNHEESDYKDTIKKERKPNDNHGIDNLDCDLVRDNISYHTNEEEDQEDEDRCELLRNPRQEPPVCEIRRFEMIKYSFAPTENYVATKECEFNDLMRTEDDARHGYQESLVSWTKDDS
ncbi:hypothetical protein Tco_1281198 [Tanacetum coccineum]